MNPPAKLSAIPHSPERQRLARLWDQTQAADEFRPLPAGEYIAGIISGELTTAKTGTPGYKIAFAVIEGEHAGRRIWHDLWLTPAALPMTKRDLGRLGITALEQLDRPLPQGIRCRVRVVLRKDDDGTETNKVKSFEVIGIATPEQDPFAPNAGLVPQGNVDKAKKLVGDKAGNNDGQNVEEF